MSLQVAYSQVIKPTHHHEQTNIIESRIDIVAGFKGVEVDQRRAVILGRPLEDDKVALISTKGSLDVDQSVGGPRAESA